MNAIKKFTNIKTVADIQILSDIGFVPVKNIMKTVKYDTYAVMFDNGDSIECADNHIFIDENNNEVFAAESLGVKIKTYTGIATVIKVNKKCYSEAMYDIQMEYHHKYYTNNVLSHNTTFAAAYICHQMVFNMDYKIAVLANKAATSREILARIKTMYEELPWFLQMGVKEWNKSSIILGNGSSVLSAAASTSSIRGKTVNCVDVNTKVTVKSKKTGIVETLTIAELENRLGNTSISG